MAAAAVDNPQIQITTTVIAAYGSYLLAEQFGFSGAIAVVVSGLLFGNYGSTSGISVRSVYALATTWEFLGFVANSLIFLLIGIALDPRQLATFGGRSRSRSSRRCSGARSRSMG